MAEPKLDFRGLDYEEVEAKLYALISDSLHEKYGENPPRIIAKRVADEWEDIQKSDLALDLAALYDIIVYCKENDYVYYMGGEEGSSLILYLLGITLCNPLPPHSYCPNCKAVQFQKELHDSFDFPQGVMCSCGKAELQGDGHDIPRQMLWMPHKCTPQFKVNLNQTLLEKMKTFAGAHWLNDFDVTFVCGWCENIDSIVLGRINLLFFHCDEATGFNRVGITSKDKDVFFQAFCEKVPPFISFRCKDYPWYCSPKSVAEIIHTIGIDLIVDSEDYTEEVVAKNESVSSVDMPVFRENLYTYLMNSDISELKALRYLDNYSGGEYQRDIVELMRKNGDNLEAETCKRTFSIPSKSRLIEYLLYRIKLRKAKMVC